MGRVNSKFNFSGQNWCEMSNLRILAAGSVGLMTGLYYDRFRRNISSLQDKVLHPLYSDKAGPIHFCKRLGILDYYDSLSKPLYWASYSNYYHTSISDMRFTLDFVLSYHWWIHSHRGYTTFLRFTAALNVSISIGKWLRCYLERSLDYVLW